MKKFLKLFFISSFILLIVLLGGVGVWYFKKYDTPDYEHRGFFPLTKLKPIWERKIKSQQTLKIGIITDTHMRAKRVDRENKVDDAPRFLPEEDLNVFKNFVLQMDLFKPDFVVHLGDIIEGTNDPDFVGIISLNLAKEEMNKVNVPIHYVIGNHELRSITKEQFKQNMNLQDLNYFFDKGDYRFIVLDANYYADGRASIPLHSSNNGWLPQETLNWVEPLLQTEKQVFIFVHHPLEHREENRKSILNADSLMVLLQKYNVKAVFSGHIEFKYFRERNGVQLFSFPGTEKNLIYNDPFYELTIENGETKVDMIYKDYEIGEERKVDFKVK